MANSILARMAVQISANTAEFNKALTATSNNLKNFTNNLTNIAGAVGVAFGLREVAAFGLEISKLAGQAEGVEAAFNRLPNSIRLMEELKRATGGTVSELELMKRAVMASNFDISLEALPRLLEFATLRAQQTGQSVDYLVDSIVTGIGRKSKLILDNLGISAAQLNEELKGVSTEAATVGDVADAVGRIAEKNLANMAGFSENAATKIQRLAASWENLKVAIGQNEGVVGRVSDGLTRFFDALSGDQLTKGINILKADITEGTKALAEFVQIGGRIDLSWQELMERGFFRNEQVAKKFAKVLKEIQDTNEAIANIKDETQLETEAIARRNKVLGEAELKNLAVIDTIGEMEDEIKRLNEAYKNISESNTTELIQNRQLVAGYEERIKKIKELGQEKLKALKIPDFAGSQIVPLQFNFEQKEKNPFVQQLDKIAAQMPKEYEYIFAQIANSIKEGQSKIKSQVDQMNEMLMSSILSFSDNIVSLIGQRLGDSTINIGSGLLRSMGMFMASFGRQLVALGVGAKGLQQLIKKPLSPAAAALAIAGGIGLIIAGNAIAASISARGSGGDFSGGGGGGGSERFNRESVTGNLQTERRYVFELKAKGSDLVAVIDTANLDNRTRKG